MMNSHNLKKWWSKYVVIEMSSLRLFMYNCNESRGRENGWERKLISNSQILKVKQVKIIICYELMINNIKCNKIYKNM